MTHDPHRQQLMATTTAQIAERAPYGQHFTHEVIADVAKGIAGEFWEQMATGAKVRRGKGTLATFNAANRFWKAWPDAEVFVGARWHEFIEPARGALTLMLGNPNSRLTPDEKDKVFEALRLDGLVNPRKLSREAEAAAEIAAKQMPDMDKLLPGPTDPKRTP